MRISMMLHQSSIAAWLNGNNARAQVRYEEIY